MIDVGDNDGDHGIGGTLQAITHIEREAVIESASPVRRYNALPQQAGGYS